MLESDVSGLCRHIAKEDPMSRSVLPVILLIGWLAVFALADGQPLEQTPVPLESSSPAVGVPDLVCPGATLIPPIETFMQIGASTSAQISGDGTTIFFMSSMSGVNQVYELFGSGWPYQLTAFVDGVDFYRASYTGSLIVVGTSAGGSEQSDLYLVSTDTYLVAPLKTATRVQHGSPVWSGDERYVYFRSNEETARDFYVYRIDVTTGAVEKIWEHAGWNEPLAVSADGAWLLVSHYDSNVNNDLYLVDLKVGGDVLLTQHQGDCTFEDARLTPDLKQVYFITNMNDDGIGRVARKPVPAGAIEFINPDSPWETEEMELSEDGKMLAWVENVEGYGSIRILDLVEGSTIGLDEMKGIATGLSLSNAHTMVFTFQSPSSPPDIWKYDIGEVDLDKLTHSTLAGIDQSLFVEPELIHYKSFDGLGIPAFLYVPSDWAGQQIPFIMDIHGGPEGQFRPTFNRHFQYLVLNGYGVFAPNVRGSSGYGREYIKLDDYKNRQNSIRDIYEGARWLADHGYAKLGKIGIKGGSYGGYATLAALVEYPDVFGAGLDDVGIANFVTFLTNTAPYRRALREAEYGPLTDQAFLLEISPITKVGNIKAPLLIVHGENDPRVPVGEARQMAQAIAAQGGVVDTLIFADEGHGASKLANRLVYYRKMVDFFDEYLK
jgi:dipeptidyl aminopeptidase/acylaminoacyl peptidase